MFGPAALMSNKFHWSLIMTFQREQMTLLSDLTCCAAFDFNLEIVKTTFTALVDQGDLAERVWPLMLVLLVCRLPYSFAYITTSLSLLMTCVYCVI